MGRERGVALLEVLVALAIIGIAGTELVSLVSAGTNAQLASRAVEERLADEERLLAAYCLLSREDLNRRIGHRDIGRYWVTIARPESVLYRVSVAAHETPETEDLLTVIYRPGVRDAP